jgi:hypothetical protein
MGEGTQHPITDPGRRMSEDYALALSQGGVGRWLAFRLDTGKAIGPKGRPDIFDTRADAVRHAPEGAHAFVCIAPLPMPPAEATAWIELHRKTWAEGFRFTDPGATMPIPALGPTATHPRPGQRPSGLIIPNIPVRRTTR